MSKMRKFGTMLLCLLSAVAMADDTFNYQLKPRQERKIVIGTEPVTTMVSDGKTGFEVVVPEAASPTAKFAGDEAAKLLGKALGAKLAVQTVPSGKLPSVIIGDTALAASSGLDLARLDRDGFYIKTIGRDVLIIGRDDPKKSPYRDRSTYGDRGERATLYGVYDFLERFAGIRFYFPGELGTIVSPMCDWKLPAIDIADRPDFPQRSTYFNCTSSKHRAVCYPLELGELTPVLWMRERRQSWTWPCCHGMEKMGYEMRFAKSHPEYFAHDINGKSVLELRKGRPPSFCFSSGFRQEVIDDAVAFLTGQPASERDIHPFRKKPEIVAWHNQLDRKVGVFDITPPDSLFPCQCLKCRKLFPPDNDSGPNKALSDFIWKFYAEVANQLKERGVKGHIAAWSYWPTTFEPAFNLPDNMLLVLCVRGPWNYRNPVAWKKEIERVAAWGQRSGSQVRLWNYWIKTRDSLLDVPMIAPRAISAYYKAVAPHVCGSFVEAECERWLYQYLNFYVYYRIMWNKDTDVEKLLEEHYRKMFGSAAVQMAEIYDELEKCWLSIAGNAVETSAGPVAVVPSDYDTWMKFYSEEMIKKLNSMFDNAEKIAAGEEESLKRIRFIRREIWQPTVEARQTWLTSLSTRDTWKCFATPGTPAVLDGTLRDPAWKKAQTVWLTGYKLDTVEVPTTVKILFDNDYFYVGFECTEPDTEKMQASPFAFDHAERWRNSTVEIFMNPSGDRKSFYHLMVDSLGGISDYCWKDGVYDKSWNSNAEVKVKIEPGKHWTAEIRLPRQSMEKAVAEFPVNFMRHRTRMENKAEIYVWSPFLKAKMAEPDNWGKLSLTPELNPSVLNYGDFEIPVHSKRWLGPWYAEKMLDRDDKVYLTGGGSIKLTDSGNRVVVQRFNLKSDTLYELSFFARLEKVGLQKAGGLRVRFDEMGGNVTWFPNIGTPLRGTIPWTRFCYRIRTAENCGSNGSPYISFQLGSQVDGTVWIDHVELREIK